LLIKRRGNVGRVRCDTQFVEAHPVPERDGHFGYFLIELESDTE
jgi:hypothetical protein